MTEAHSIMEFLDKSPMPKHKNACLLALGKSRFFEQQWTGLVSPYVPETYNFFRIILLLSILTMYNLTNGDATASSQFLCSGVRCNLQPESNQTHARSWRVWSRSRQWSGDVLEASSGAI